MTGRRITMKSAILVAVIAALGLPILAGCVTVPQSDLAEAVKASIQPAVDTFFEELEKQTNPTATVIETGYLDVHAPEAGATPPDFILNYHEPAPMEPSQDDPPEAWVQWEVERAAWAAAMAETILAWRLSETYRSYVDWGFWATLNDEPLFKVVLHGNSARESQWCRPDAGCLPWGPHALDATLTGTPTDRNPISGSASWVGQARGVSHNGTPVTGTANLEADLGAGLIDVHLMDLGPETLSWTRLVMQDGAFKRVDEPERYGWTLGISIAGAFYGPNHEGVAGEFTHHRMIGVFGALRDSN